jgi:putative endopeptidase
MNRVFIMTCSFLIAGSSLLIQPLMAADATTPNHGIEVKQMDLSVKPCEDFYKFANGTWLANNPIPADRASWGAGSEVQERNYAVLHQLLDEAAKNTTAPVGSIERKVGDFYRIGMDEKQIEADGATPLKGELDRINAVSDIPGLVSLLAHQQRVGINTGFGFFVNQDFKNSSQMIGWLYQAGLGLPDRDYYLTDDARMKTIREQYVEHVTKMFTLLGDSAEDAAAHAKTIMDMETKMAQASMTKVQQRDPNGLVHPMTVAELTAADPSIPWDLYFKGIGIADPGTLNIGQPDFVKQVNQMVKETPLSDWKTYLRWHLIDAAAPYLSSNFVNEDFHFNSNILNGVKEIKPRWKRVLEATDNNLGEALGQLYVAKAFPPEAKQRALVMVQNLKAALRERLNSLDWISEDTRKAALLKVDAIMVKIGYPDKWRDYSKLPIDQKTYVQNVAQATEFEFQRNVNKIGKPIDRTEWGMTPPTVNAYYNPSFNEIVFPAGILQPPFFNPQADDATNYGSMGSVIGHELTHGFDDQGHQFDAQGNLKNWWTEQDDKNYAARAELVQKQYDDYVPIEDLHINGKLTLGENIADFGGLKIAYIAFQKTSEAKSDQKIDGFTPDQRFFIAFAQGWRRNFRAEQLRLQLNTDPHSPSRFRVLGPISRLPEFYKAFSCQPPANAENDQFKSRIW